MKAFKRYTVVCFSLLFLLLSNGLFINEHFCNKSEKSYVNIIQESHCCSDDICDNDAKDENCCQDFAYFIKSDVNAFVSKYTLILESKFIDFNAILPQIIPTIVCYLVQTDEQNTFIRLSKKLSYLQPNIHQLQVMLC